MERLYQINPADNVAVVLVDGDPTAPRGHKIALRDIAKDENVIKYGFPIGHATAPIRAGEWVHSHNLATNLGADLEYSYNQVLSSPAEVPAEVPQFMGYPRAGGLVGIRNELWIVPTVGCVNGQAQEIVRLLKESGVPEGVDDIRAYTHNFGCSQLGEDHANTRAALASLAKHPNAGGVLVLGLGCENNQIDRLRREMGEFDESRVEFLNAQDVEDEVETGVEICRRLVDRMKTDRRVPMPVSKLRIGLKCGGSDGFSGITANPLLGRFSDRMAAWGATTLLTEVPEMFGAETILMNRAKDAAVFGDTVKLINNFKAYFRSYGQPIYENPSPGNKAGGITTLEEKSLGCVQKGGSSVVNGVLGYAEQVSEHGLNLLNAPGNDLVASTALGLSGCHMVLFSTGRGTPFGTFVPTLKVATNTQLASRKRNWIDFNAGVLLDSDADSDVILDNLVDKVLSVAGGEPLRHELTGAKDIAIFKTGVTL